MLQALRLLYRRPKAWAPATRFSRCFLHRLRLTSRTPWVKSSQPAGSQLQNPPPFHRPVCSPRPTCSLCQAQFPGRHTPIFHHICYFPIRNKHPMPSVQSQTRKSSSVSGRTEQVSDLDGRNSAKCLNAADILSTALLSHVLLKQ